MVVSLFLFVVEGTVKAKSLDKIFRIILIFVFTFGLVGVPESLVLARSPLGIGNGLYAEYRNLGGTEIIKTIDGEGPINHGWNGSCPDTNIYQNECGSWAGIFTGWSTLEETLTGYIEAPVTGTYEFHSGIDDYLQITINGITDIVDDVSGGGYSIVMDLEAGQFYPITMHFKNRWGSANLSLFWTKPDNTFEIVPKQYLYTQIPVIKVGLVTSQGGIADLSFNWMAYQGLLQAETDFGVDGTLYESASPDDYLPLLQQCATDGNHLCFAVSYFMGDAVAAAANAYPNTKFAILDNSSDTPPANLRTITFNEKQAAYLAGALAGKLTATNKVGVVGGMEIPPVVAFAEGFRNGAQCANPNAEVLINYTGSFDNFALGETTAQGMISQGVDAIFGVGGQNGNGAIMYGTQHEILGVGVDVDQYVTLFGNGSIDGSDKLLTSAMKKLDFAVWKTIEDYINGNFTSGSVVYHLADGGVGMAPYHETDASIPQAIKDYVITVNDGIIQGTIDVNDTCRLPAWDVVVESGYLSGPFHMDFDNAGNLFVANEMGNGVSKISPDRNVSLFSGGMVGAAGLEFNSNGVLFVSDDTNRIFYLDETGGQTVFVDDSIASLSNPNAIAFDSQNNLYAVSAGGFVSKFAADGALLNLYLADSLHTPEGIVVDNAAGKIYVSDWDGQVFEIDMVSGNKTLYAQTNAHTDGGLARDANGNIYLSAIDTGLVYRIDALTQNASSCLMGLDRPRGLTFGPDGRLYVTEYSSGRILSAAGCTEEPAPGYNPYRDARFHVQLYQNNIEGYGWPAGVQVTITIDTNNDGTPEFVSTPETVVSEPWNPAQTIVRFNDVGGITFAPGMYVTMSDGIVTKTHVVTSLTLGGVDPDTERVWGTAEPGSWVSVGHLCDETGCAIRNAQADENGDWLVDFSVLGTGTGGDEQLLFDIRPGIQSEVRQNDGDSDHTDIDWRVHNPTIEIFLRGYRIEARDWPLGNVVTLTIDRPGTTASPDFSTSLAIQPASWNPGENAAEFDLKSLFNYDVGDVITVSDGTLTKTTTLTNVTITNIDTSNGTISGMTEPNMDIQVRIHRENGSARLTTADGSGAWNVDFSVPSGNWGTYELVPGLNGDASRIDEDGDLSRYDWYISAPSMSARLTENEVHGYEWMIGSPITLTIDDPENGPGDDYSSTLEAVPADWDQSQGFVQFRLWESNFQLEPGQVVTMTDGSVTKSLTVAPLAITVIDQANDKLYGTASPGAQVDNGHLLCNQYGCFGYRRVIADSNGAWMADFSVVGEDSDEQDLIDIKPGTGSEARQCDTDGDCTQYGWYISNPVINIHADDDWLEGYEWLAHTTVHVTIDDPATPENPDLARDLITGTSDWNSSPNYFGLDLAGQFDIQPGFVVTATDGESTKEHAVTNMVVTDVNAVTDIITGKANSYGYLRVEIFDGAWAEVNADVDGNWSFDFTEQFDIQAGNQGRAKEYDNDGDSTGDDWAAYLPPLCQPGNSISGTVYFGDGSSPIGGASVIFENFDTGENLFQAVTNKDGNYSCHLPVGNYRIWAAGGNQSREYFEESIFENASQVIVSDGSQQAGVNFSLNTPVFGIQNLYFNLDTSSLVSEQVVRQAIAYGTNRQRIANATYVGSEVLNSIMPDFYWAYPESGLPLYEYNPAHARDILENAGWVDSDLDGIREQGGVRLHLDYYTSTFNNPNHIRTRLYSIFVADMAEIGIEVQVYNMNNLGFINQTPRAWDLAQFAWGGIDLNVDQGPDNAQWFYYTGANENVGGYSNTAADALLDAANNETTRAGKLSYLQNHQIQVMTDLPALPLVLITDWPLNFPSFSARLTENQVHAYNWPLGSELTLTIDDPDNGVGVDYSNTITVGIAEWDWTQTGVRFELGEFTLAPGQIITLSDGLFTRTTTVANLLVTAVDPDTDIVTGTASPGAQVDIGHLYCNDTGCYGFRREFADINGNWTANFSVAGEDSDEQDIVDIKPGIGSEARTCDEDGDCTQYGWDIPNPYFSVRANDNQLEVYQWPMGSTLSIEIDDPGTVDDPDYSTTRLIDELASWNPSQTYEWLDLNGIIDIQPGFIVRVTDGATLKAHIVTSLAFTEQNVANDTVTGLATPLTLVNAWACANNHCVNRHDTADENGIWMVDFSQPGNQNNEHELFDLQPGSWVDSIQNDDDGDGTMFGQNVPSPRINAIPSENAIELTGWGNNINLTLTIDDPTTPQPVDYTITEVVPDRWHLDLGPDFTLTPGQTITVTSAGNNKSLLVSTLAVTGWDFDAGTISGVASNNSQVRIYGYTAGYDASRLISSDVAGNWTADFANVGAKDFEQTTLPVVNGTYGDVYITDTDGDSTLTGFTVYTPWIAPENVPLAVPIIQYVNLSRPTYTIEDWTVLNLLFEPVYRVTQEGTLVPAAAVGHVVSPDGLTYTFTLHDNMYWSDGEPVTAQNYVDGFMRVLSPATTTDYASLLYHEIAGAEAFNNGTETDPATVGITATGLHTLQITLISPAAHFPHIMSIPGFFPVRLDAPEPYQITNGPYTLLEYEGTHLLVGKNQYYYNEAQVYFNQIGLPIIPDTTEQLEAYKRGEVDALTDAPQAALADPAYGAELVYSSTPGVFTIGLNTQQAPTNNPLVRKALAAATDRRTLIDDVLGISWVEPASGVIPPEIPGYQGNDVGYPYNPTQAQDFLAQAGYPGGVGLPPVRIYGFPRHESMLQALANQWQNTLGIMVEVHLRGDFNGWIANECIPNNLQTCDYNGIRFGWYMDYFDAHNMLSDWFTYMSPRTGWDNENFQSWLNAARAEQNPATRIFDLQQAESFMVEDDAAVIPLYFLRRVSLVKPGFSTTYGLLPYFEQWSYHAPIFARDDAYPVQEDTILEVDALAGVLSNDTNTDLDPIWIQDLTPSTTGATVSMDAYGAFTYEPAPNYCGSDSFTYAITDGVGISGYATVSVDVSCVNDTPRAHPFTLFIEKNTTWPITLLGSDADDDPLTFTIVTNPAHGSLAGTAPNLTYTPVANYLGADSFAFKVGDGQVESFLATITIQVTNVITPVLPSSFYGEVHIYDTPPSVGSILEAYIPGASGPVANTPLVSYAGALIYSIDVPAGAQGSGLEGAAVTFKLDDRVVATGTWHSGTQTELKIHPPKAITSGAYTGDEGSSIVFSASADDWGANAASYQWDWDNDGTFDTTAQETSHTWGDNGTHTVTLKVTDTQGGTGFAQTEVTVNDVLPSNVGAGGTYIGVAGQVVNLAGSATCASGDGCVFAWDLDSDGQYDDATGLSTSYVWNNAGDFTVWLKVSDDDGNNITSPASVHITGATHSLTLVKGWNLVSFNVHPANTSVSAVLASVSGNFDLVYAWDATGDHASSGHWMRYAPALPPSLNTLTSLNETMGFWIHMINPDVLDVTGNVPVTTNITLTTNAGGWNLVSYPSSINRDLPSILTNYGVGTDFSLVYSYRAHDVADQWKLFNRTGLPIFNDLTALAPGWGYWVKSTAAHTWNVKYIPD